MNRADYLWLELVTLYDALVEGAHITKTEREEWAKLPVAEQRELVLKRLTEPGRWLREVMRDPDCEGARANLQHIIDGLPRGMVRQDLERRVLPFLTSGPVSVKPPDQAEDA